MRIIIIGDGKVGHKLAQQLSNEEHDIQLIDQRVDKLKNTLNELDVNCIEGDGASQQVLESAGVDHADIVIAAASSDSMNMVCCLIAKKLGAKRTIARVRNPVYFQQMHLIKDDLGLSMAVNPELAAAEDISRVLIFPNASRIETLAKGRAEIVEFKLTDDSRMVGLTLEDMGKKFPGNFLICVVQRGDEVYIPNGQFTLQAGDKINIIASHREVEKFFKMTGKLKHKIDTVMIGGGGRIAYYLARKLSSIGMHVKLIEKDKDKCLDLCDTLEDVTVIHGDATDHELLIEAGIERVDAFVSLTGIDEENIIMSMYAKTKNVSKIITKVNSEYLTKMMDGLGMESVVSPKAVTADAIVGYVRAMQNSARSTNIEAVYRLLEDKVEALEFYIHRKTEFTGIPLKNLKLKKGLLIGSIVRGRKIMIANGDSTLEPGDSVIVVSHKHRLQSLKEILGK